MNTFVDYDIASLNISYIEKCLKNYRAIRNIYFIFSKIFVLTKLGVQWSEFLTTNHEVPGSIPVSTVGIFLEAEDPRGDRGLGRLVDFRLRPLLALHPPLSPLTHHRDNVSAPHWRPKLRRRLQSSHTQEGGPRSPQRTCGGIGGGETFFQIGNVNRHRIFLTTLTTG